MATVPDLHPKLAETLAALRAAGVQPTDAEIVWLGRLREPCDNPESHAVRHVIGAPLIYCGISFWPLHWLAEDWWKLMYVYLERRPLLRQHAYIFAHLFSAPGDVRLRDWNGETALDLVRAWVRKSPIHKRQLPELFDSLMVLDEYKDEPDGLSDKPNAAEPKINSAHGSLAALCRAFPGTTPDYWYAGISKADAEEIEGGYAAEGEWATSPTREAAIRRYMRAVQFITESRRG